MTTDQTPTPKRQSAAPMLLALIAIACLAFFVISRQNGGAPVSPANTPSSVGGGGETVTLSCKECADAGMLISLWESPGASVLKLSGQLPHNTRVQVVSTRPLDGDIWYHVQSGGVSGWVKSEFIVR